MTSYVKEPFQLVNPFSKYFLPIAATLVVIALNIATFGFLGPALVSAAASEAVIAGFALVVVDLFLTAWLGVTIVNAVLRRRAK